jgi:hypothetical protein
MRGYRLQVVRIVAAVFATMVLGNGTSLTGVAQANVGSCPGTLNYDFIQDRWEPADQANAGFRAPIELRKNGDVCSDNGVVYEWVGIFTNGSNGGISQIGWADYYPMGYCRFWYWDNGNGSNSGVMFNHCGDDSIGTSRFFKVEETNYSGTHRYSIYDCGTGGWGTCNSLDNGPGVNSIGDVNAGALTESPTGQNCKNIIMGSSGNPTVFGGGPGDIQGMKQLSGSWDVRSLDYIGPACSHYDTGTHSDSQMKTYDDRN